MKPLDEIKNNESPLSWANLHKKTQILEIYSNNPLDTILVTQVALLKLTKQPFRTIPFNLHITIEETQTKTGLSQRLDKHMSISCMRRDRENVLIYDGHLNESSINSSIYDNNCSTLTFNELDINEQKLKHHADKLLDYTNHSFLSYGLYGVPGHPKTSWIYGRNSGYYPEDANPLADLQNITITYNYSEAPYSTTQATLTERISRIETLSQGTNFTVGRTISTTGYKSFSDKSKKRIKVNFFETKKPSEKNCVIQ